METTLTHLASAGMEQLGFDWPQGKLTYRSEPGKPYKRRIVRFYDMHAYNACRIAAGDYDGWGSQGLSDDSHQWARYVWVMPGTEGHVRLLGVSQGVLALFEVEGAAEGFEDGRWLAVPREWAPKDTHLVNYAIVAKGDILQVYAGGQGSFGVRGYEPRFAGDECVLGKLVDTVALTPPPYNPPLDRVLSGECLRTAAWFSEGDAKMGAWCDLATVNRALECYRIWMVDNKPIGWPYRKGRVREPVRLRIGGDGLLEMTMSKGSDSRGLLLVSASRGMYDVV